MKLRSFRVTKYRNIQDSGTVEVEDDLTCIVGKNQSGKTALLRALHGFNPTESDHIYDLDRDWPRSERLQRNPEQVVCAVTFALTEPELRELRGLSGVKLQGRSLVVTRNYGGSFEIKFPDDGDMLGLPLHPNVVDEYVNQLPVPHTNAGLTFHNEARQCKEELRRLAREGRFAKLLERSGTHELLLRSHLPDGAAQRQRAIEFCDAYRDALGKIAAKIEELPIRRRSAHDYIVNAMPRFLYMDEYRDFSGTAVLTEVRDRLARKASSPRDTTFLALLSVAGLDLKRLITQGESGDGSIKQQRMHDLVDASEQLSQSVSQRWEQKPYRVRFHVDGQTFFTMIQPMGEQGDPIPLEEQSRGFRWFFSFDLRFMHDSNGTFENCVILLDEPGLHLHPGGQRVLLRRFDAYAEHNTLLYTTHLPFLVDLREPHRLKVIREDGSSATVTADLASAGSDEKLTLQAALGMSLDQHFLISRRNLVVEGAHDYWIIAELAKLLERCGEEALPDDVMVTAAAGASHAVLLSTFMIGQNLQVVTIFDSDREGEQQEAQLRKKWLARYKGNTGSTLLLGPVLGISGEVTIEDLFEAEFYASCTVAAHQGVLRTDQVDAIDLDGNGPLCRRVQRAFDSIGVAFNKGSVAKEIRKRVRAAKSLADLSPVTQERTRKLFRAIRHEFERAKDATASG